MLQSRFKKVCCGAAVACAVLLGTAGSAQAAVYTGMWDPAFGGIFTNLGWRGTATFVLPDSCVGLTGTFANAATPCGGGGMQVIDATVEFYDLRDTSQTALQTLDFGAAPAVNSMSIDSLTHPGMTDLTGANTEFFRKVQGNVSVAQFSGQNYYFQLGLRENQAALFYTLDLAETALCATPAFGTADPKLCGFSARPAAVVFTPAIPEPSTYALFLAGLAGMWALRRRMVPAAIAR